ncbi:MAG TPA: hypothetical protein PKA31_02665 [Candidatus Moranbacteria bacterium]|nr:hypothetical protein [Candidatus Moranbacteria bacterium]
MKRKRGGDGFSVEALFPDGESPSCYRLFTISVDNHCLRIDAPTGADGTHQEEAALLLWQYHRVLELNDVQHEAIEARGLAARRGGLGALIFSRRL